MDIYERLAEGKPERFEYDWAMSLNNYAAFLSENGRSEDALAVSKQAMDIYERLAKGKPERYENDWAVSLNNYASVLNENGRSEVALAFNRQAIEIYRKLVTKLPLKYGASYRRWVLYQCFLTWLCDSDEWTDLLPKSLDVAAVEHSKREWGAVAFYEQCVRACLTMGTPEQLRHTANAITKWPEIDAAMQKEYEELFFIVSAIEETGSAAQQQIALLSDWHSKYKAMVKRRHGRIPAWLQTATQRLGLKLPVC
jgi:tetratricopeptide (TPR) repeat protein